MIALRTAEDVATFLTTLLGRLTEPILKPHLERLAQYGREDNTVRGGTQILQGLGLDRTLSTLIRPRKS